MIKDIIFVQDGEKFQITYKELSNKNDVLTVQPFEIVLEDIANAVSDLPFDDRTQPDPPPPGTIDPLSLLMMEIWKDAYIASWKKELADRTIEDFKESFGIVDNPNEESQE